MTLLRIPRRACVLATAVTAGVLCTAVPAAADVTVSPATATRGTGVNLSFRVVNDRTVAMTGVSLALPPATPVAEVYPLSVPSWAPKITNRKLNPPMKGMHGSSLITEATASIAWTAAKGKAIPPKGATEFMIAIGPMPETETMTFTLLGTYADGKAGPAIAPAVVTLTSAAAADPGLEHIPDVVPTFPETLESGGPDSGGPDSGFAGAAGWIVAALCAVAGGISVLRSRRRRIDTGPVKIDTDPVKRAGAKVAQTPAPRTTTQDAPSTKDGQDLAAALANNQQDLVRGARVTAWSYRDSP